MTTHDAIARGRALRRLRRRLWLCLAVMGALAVPCLTFGPLPAGADEADLAEPVAPPGEGHPLEELYSGYRYQPAHVKKMQDDDIKNPGMLWYEHGRELWSMPDGEAGKSCADCHNRAEKAMRGVGARYPQFSQAEAKPINLGQRINLCRSQNMKAKPWPVGSEAMIAMKTYVRAQSRGMPVRVKIGGQAAPFFEAGKAYYYRKRGELDTSCAGCHEDNAGEMLGATTISQGQSNGFPAYRIGTERVETLHQQFKRCNRRVQAQPLPLGSNAYVNLELYLAWRGSWLPVETPAVRN